MNAQIATQKGLDNLKAGGHLDESTYKSLSEDNLTRASDRVREFMENKFGDSWESELNTLKNILNHI